MDIKEAKDYIGGMAHSLGKLQIIKIKETDDGTLEECEGEVIDTWDDDTMTNLRNNLNLASTHDKNRPNLRYLKKPCFVKTYIHPICQSTLIMSRFIS